MDCIGEVTYLVELPNEVIKRTHINELRVSLLNYSLHPIERSWGAFQTNTYQQKLQSTVNRNCSPKTQPNESVTPRTPPFSVVERTPRRSTRIRCEPLRYRP